ncbi:MAG: DUF11 domain-containing protein, partial [Anaerolineae bacterium]|nr:DUF11 domain-containing protein [Anaerolineae bacterium]
MPPTISETFSLQLLVGVQATGDLVNVIEGATSQAEISTLNNQAVHTTTIAPSLPGPDLSVNKSGPATVLAGQAINYNITVANQGGQAATGVVVTDTLPVSMTFVSSSHPAYNTSYDPQTGVIVFGIGTLAPQATYHINLQAIVTPTAPSGLILNNQMTGHMSQLDPNAANNNSSVITIVLPPMPRITLQPATGGTPSGAALLSMSPETTASLLITATNTGTDVLVGGLAVMTNPAETAVNYPWLAITPSVITDDLAPGAWVTFTVTAALTPGVQIGNYYDIIGFEAPQDSRAASRPFYLRVYVHPELVTFNAAVTNTLENPVAGAQILLEKHDASVFSVDGENKPPQYFTRFATTNSEGQTTLSQMEVGTYTYTVGAAGHRMVTGTFSANTGTTLFAPSPYLLALPGLVFVPNQALLNVTAGETTAFHVQVRNEGPGYAEDFAVETPLDVPWISSALPPEISVLAPGEAMSVTLFMHPPTSEAGSPPYYKYITVTADHVAPAWLATTINVLDTTTGTVEFVIVDELDLPISGAEVTVINENGRIINGSNGPETIYDTQSITTNASGQAILEGLSPGEYSYTVMAGGFHRGTGVTAVQPGIPAPGQNNNRVQVRLNSDPFDYSWTVVETEIQDTYAITVVISYHAEVPKPLLFVSYALFCPGDDVPFMVANLSEVPMENVVLTPNHGGVAFNYAPNGTSSVNIGDLPPGSAFTGVLETSSSGSEVADSGRFDVSATYETSNGILSYSTHNSTIKHCTPGLPGIWQWSFDEESNSVIGNYIGNPPEFITDNGPSISLSENDDEDAIFTLSGYATLERQAFFAELNLEANVYPYTHVISDVTVDIEVTDLQGNIIENGFAITPTVPTALGDLNSSNLSLTGRWLLIPGELGITDPGGAWYYVRAHMSYILDGVPAQKEMVSRVIVVYPQPFVRLEFTHTQPDKTGDFYVEVTAHNDGLGVARDLTLDLSDVSTVAPLDGDDRSLIFDLKETTINGIAQPTDYVFHFGDIQPTQSATGRWRIGVRASDGAPLVNQVVTGFRVSCRHLPFLGLELSQIIDCNGVFNQYHIVTRDCPFHTEDTCAEVGGPIVTGNGNYTYRQSTPRIPTVGTPLEFTWTYNSINTGINPGFPVISSTLGAGWTHNYQMTLDLSRMHTAERTVFVRAPHGTPLNFWVVQADQFRPAPGIHATLTRGEIAPDRYLYTMTVRNQLTYVFSDTGRLLSQRDAKGLTVAFEYNPQGQLEQVREPISGRFLDFTYHPDGRLASVSDPISRTTAFGYNELGHLSTITDTRNQVWQYEYTLVGAEQYLLSHILDPDGRTVEQTGFDDFGRAITQTFRGQDLSIAYLDDGRRVITDSLGHETIHIYDQQDLLIGRVEVISRTAPINKFELELYSLDAHYNRTYFQDQNGNPTYYEKTPIGLTTLITDSFTNTMSLAYNDQYNWTQREGWRGDVTLYDYDPQGLLLITQTNHFSDTVLYAYNDYGQRTSVTDENEVTTEFGYDELGQMTVITDALEHTTHFEYDGIGRLITTTDTMGQVTVNEYDGGDNLIRVIENVHPTEPAQNYLDKYNIVTAYGYDGTGNRIAITNTVGQVERFFYDEYGRVITHVINFTTTLPLCQFAAPHPEYNICNLTTYDPLGRVVATTDSLGRVERTFYDRQGQVAGIVKNWTGAIATMEDLPDCLALPTDRDGDICTLFGYDPAGNNTIMTDTVGHMSRFFYDPLNRLEGIILNWDGQITLSGCLNLPTERDSNICTLYAYDEAGNTTVVTDTLGQMTHTYYDILGRVEYTVANWNSATLDNPAQDCVFAANNSNKENICTHYEYDPVGNQTVTTNALGQKTLAVYDGLNRPFITVAAWDGVTVIATEDDCLFPPAKPDANLCTVTYYDNLNRPYRSKDPMGNLSDIGFDDVGRVITTTRYLGGLDGIPVPTVVTYNALGLRLGQTDAEDNTVQTVYDALNRPYVTISAEGITITRTFDAASRVLSTTNSLGYVTTMVYDNLDRITQTIDPEQNVTQIEYDVLGNRTAVIDANLIRTTYEYDDLGRLVHVIENDTGGTPTNESNIVTTYMYDALGNQLRVINGRALTSTTILYNDLYWPTVITDALDHAIMTEYN